MNVPEPPANLLVLDQRRLQLVVRELVGAQRALGEAPARATALQTAVLSASRETHRNQPAMQRPEEFALLIPKQRLGFVQGTR